MSSSTVTYTSISNDYEEPSDVGSLGVVVYGYDGLPMHPPSSDYVLGPEQPPSPDYVPGLEYPPSPVHVPYVPEPEYLEYLVPSRDEARIEDQPLSADAPSIALSHAMWLTLIQRRIRRRTPRRIMLTTLQMEGMVMMSPLMMTMMMRLMTRIKRPLRTRMMRKEEKEHLASAEFSIVHVIDPVPSSGVIEAFETDESTPSPPSPPRSPQTKVLFSQTRLCMVQKTIRLEPPMSASMKARIAEHAAAPTPPSSPPSPLSPWSSPLPRIPSPPLPVSSPPLPLPSPLTTSLADAEAPLGYRAAGIRMRALLPSTFHMINILKAEIEVTYARRAWTGFKDRSAAIEANVRTLEAHVATLMAQTSSLQT
nr:hypothetical protein [Tanacetum cinerariifolium]